MGEEYDTFQIIQSAIEFENDELLVDVLSGNPLIVKGEDNNGRSPLMLAAHNGRVRALQTLIHLAPDCINYQSPINGKTALHLACEAGEIPSVSLLIEAGADPSIIDNDGYCALEKAHISGHSAVAKILIDAIQAEESRVEKCHLSLLAAVVHGDIEVMHQILEGKKNIDKILNGKKGKGVLLVACENGRLDAVELFLKEPYGQYNILIDYSSGDSILHAAISSHNILLVQLILQNYPTLASRCNKEGSSVLHWAVRARNVDIVQLLLNFPYPEYALIQVDNHSLNYRFAFDLNAGDCECRTALYLSVQQSDVNVLNVLLAMTLAMEGSSKCPFLVDTYCTKGRTPLMVAVRNKNIELISILLSHGADINLPLAILDEGETRAVGSGALLEASRVNSLEVAKILLSNGAVDTSNRALKMGINMKSESIILLLLSRLGYPDNEMKVNKTNFELGQIPIGETLVPSFLLPSKSVIINWSDASLSFLLPEWISSAAMHINTRMRTTTLSFAAITRVDISDNKIDVFPPLLWQLPSLRILNLSSNKLTRIELPNCTVYSSLLECLLLSNNKLITIESSLLLHFPSLSILDLSSNSLSILPDSIWICPSLKELNVSNNNISALPSAPRSMRREVVHCREESPPIKTMTRGIERRSIWQKEVRFSLLDEDDVIEERLSSHTLHTLNLSHNKFRIFPISLCCLTPRLLHLFLSHNLLSSICSFSDLPPSLRTLDVSYNSLNQMMPLSSIVGECYAGERERRCSPNRQSRSRSKSAVRSQRALSITRMDRGGGNEVCAHRMHSILPHLKTLNLSCNHLKNILLCKGDIVLTPSLATLDCSENEINELDGMSLSRLSSLCVLSLSSNPLTIIPPQIGLLSHLWSLSLKDCPLYEPLLSLVNAENSKTLHILAYLRGILEESKSFPYLKLFILGECKAGKSTLADAIKGEGNSVKSITQGKCARVFQCKLTTKKYNNPVTFSVWDTNGEVDIRPLIQYSYCRRAVYVVVFRVTEGVESLHSLTSFLLSIQSRASNASVVIVGTHLDELILNSIHSSLIIDLEREIKSRLLNVDGGGENNGLPRIIDILFVSLKKKNDIRSVVSSIMKSAHESRIGKDLTLTLNIPYSYICIFNALSEICEERKKNGKELIISQSSFIKSTKEFMKKKLGRYLRDEIELSLGISFVRDSGGILKVEYSSLSPLIILDPLCFLDNLSLILSIRSGNRPAGIIPLSSLSAVKEVSSLGIQLVPLLHNMSLAVLCHSNLLLLPSLLPDEFCLRSDLHARLVQMEARSISTNSTPISKINWSHRHMNLVRIYHMTYIPYGFWPRLISRVTWDESISRVMGQLGKSQGLKWSMWQNGLELMNVNDRMLIVKEYFPFADPNEYNIHAINWRIKVEGKWRGIDLSCNSCLLIYIPMLDNDQSDNHGLWTKIISLIVETIDCLLEDWYPSIGTRFLHSSQGVLLVNRLVICPSCYPFVPPSQITRDDSYTHEYLSDNGIRLKNRSRTLNELSTLHSTPVSLFSIEECMESAMIKEKEVECPQHGIISLASLSPDILFLDIHSSLRIDDSCIKRSRLIGRGSFGFVFRAHLKSANSINPYEIAQKMMEPCNPGINARGSALNEYKANVSKWERESLEYSTRAYLSIRQEIDLLSRLSHPNILSLIGITCCPLSLLVEMAPLGSLRYILTSFKKSESKLSIVTLVESAVQVAKALEYLHSNNIVYRDLKSENVLVWRFPPPFCIGDVQLKLGDYGISRQGQPSGDIKGFGGTEGFMAPEIVKWNGEEEYSLKVDIFSFGMFLYELITLKLPFESEEHVKDKILNGGRPLLMPSECLWPCFILDVICICWSPSPISRPSSSNLVSIFSAPELSHLIDTLILSSQPDHIILGSSTIEDGVDEAHIWVISQSTIDIYSCNMFGWVECISTPIPSWGKGRLYNVESNDWIWKVNELNELSLLPFSLSHSLPVNMPQLDMNPLISTPLPISSSLFFLPSKFSLHLLYREDHSLTSFNLIESITSPFQIISFAFLNHQTNRQIWTGHDGGVITAHFISSDDRFSFSSSFSHPDTFLFPVIKLISSKDGTVVWSYLEGCSRVFCWEGSKRNLTTHLDLRKVQPASETIHTIEMDSSCHITSMCVFERIDNVSLLFVGTKEGCLIVLSAASLQPLSACRPYSSHINTLSIIHCKNGEETQPGSTTTSTEGAIGWMREKVQRLRSSNSVIMNQSDNLLLTIGTGFRSLIDRFVSQTESKNDIVASLWKIDDWQN